MKYLREKVLWCLEKIPETRNSDIKLTNAIWVNYYPETLKLVDGQYFVKLTDIYELPTVDDVKRIRATIQNHPTKPQFLPTDERVRRQRKIKEEIWRSYLGYNPELRAV